MRNRSGLFWPIIGATTLPFAIASASVFLDRSIEQGLPDEMWLVLYCLAIGSGAAATWVLPMSRGYKAMIVLIYVPIVAFVLPFYTLIFVGQIYGDWL